MQVLKAKETNKAGRGVEVRVASCDFKSGFQGNPTGKVTREQSMGISQERRLQEEGAASAKALR